MLLRQRAFRCLSVSFAGLLDWPAVLFSMEALDTPAIAVAIVLAMHSGEVTEDRYCFIIQPINKQCIKLQ